MKAFFSKELKTLFAATTVATTLFAQSVKSQTFDSADQSTTAVKSTPSGELQYAVMLRAKPLAAAYADALAQGRRMTDGEQRSYVANLQVAQTTLLNQITALGGRQIARVRIAVNAIYISATASVAEKIGVLQGVRSVQALIDFHKMADPTPDYKVVVPLIGANRLRDAGVDGSGVRVAVLDSGIDYTHAAFGGGGTPEAFIAAYGTSTNDPRNKAPVSWPQGNVVGGFDFIGETWPTGPLAPDPDPIGAPAGTNNLGITGTDGSHGTSVADIIAGRPFPSRPDNHGVAPGASLYAVKVCSAVSSSCSNIGIVQGVEWAMDPDGDGSISDAVDVINLSLGANYGQKEDSSSEAVSNAARIGIVVCCAAGNAADNPYIVSSPSSAPEVISVAQTTLPNEKVFILNVTSSAPPSPISIRNTNTVDWAPIVGTTTGVLTPPVPSTACARQPSGSLNGRIALVDRGVCNISFKIAYAQDAGAIGVVLVNNAPGDPPSFSFGGIPDDLPQDFVISIPVIVISQEDGNALKARRNAGATLTATISDANFVSTSSTIVTSSSRGPSLNFNTIKPEIGAPGGNLAAVSGSGTGFATFSGTSGATPVIAGSAALVRQRFPGLPPLQVKARLMNNANPDIFQNQIAFPGQFAPISRIGAGEVRALPAVEASSSAWVVGTDGAPSVPALSFGFWRLSGPQSFTKTVRVKNDSNAARTYAISRSTRFDPGTPGGVTISAPSSISVGAGATADFDVTATVTPANLPNWNTDSGIFGADGPRLAALEYGGFVTLTSGSETLRLPWHLLPQKSHRALVSTGNYTLGTPSPTITNTPSSIPAIGDVYALTGTSPRLPAGVLPFAGEEFTLTDLQSVGVRVVPNPAPLGPVLEFAITTWSRHTHANAPSAFTVTIDVNRDGNPEWFLFNDSISATDRRNQTFLAGNIWPTAFSTLFTKTDFNSTNTVLQVPINRIGLTVPSTPSGNPVANPLPLNQPFSFTVFASDNYFTGDITDVVGPMTYTAGQPKYVVRGGLGTVTVPAGGTVSLPITSTGQTSSTSQRGILLLFPNGRTNFESKAITVTP